MAKLVAISKDEVRRSHEKHRELLEKDPHLKAEMDGRDRRRSNERAKGRARGAAVDQSKHRPEKT